MPSNNFLLLPKSECIIAYKKILANSDSQWTLAKELSGSHRFGPGIAMAILSTEELIKAILVLMDGKGFSFRNVKGIDIMFRNHQIRYLIAYMMFAANFFGEELMKLIINVKEGRVNPLELMNKIQTNDPRFSRQLLHYGILQFRKLRTDFEWFSKIDVSRQDAFYSGFDGAIKSPIEISSDEYEDFIFRLGKVRMVGLQFIEAVESPEAIFQDHLRQMRRDFTKNKYYKKMGVAITMLNESKGDPFAFFSNFLKGDFTPPNSLLTRKPEKSGEGHSKI